MKKRKLLLGLAIASTSILALAACGSKKESSSAASSAASSSTAASSAATSSTATSSTATSSAAASSAASSSAVASSVVSSSDAATTPVAGEVISVSYMDGSRTIYKDDAYTKGTDLYTPVKNGFTFEGWYSDSALTNEVTDTLTLTSGSVLYAKWSIPENHETVTYQLLPTDLDAGAVSSTITSGVFSITGGEIRNRIKSWTNPYNSSETITSWTKSIKNGPIQFTAPGSGQCTMYLQNGSSSAATKKIKISSSTEEAQLIEFSGADAVAPYNGGSPVVAITFQVTNGSTYTIERGDGGTIDWYQFDLECVMEISEESGFAIANEGTTTFFEGESYDSSKIQLNATYNNGKIMPLDMTSTDIVIDSSNYNATVPGNYTISVKYKDYAAQTITVTVCEITGITAGLNANYKSSQATSAGNSQYVNGKVQTVYSLNDTLNTDYLNVTVIGEDKDGNQFSKIVSTGISYSDVDFTTTGTKTVTVTLSMNEKEFTDSYDIYVVDTAAYTDEDGNYVVTVDQNYTGVEGAVNGNNGNTFTTIAAALEYLGSARVTQATPKILNIAAGYYNEKLEITVPYLTIRGAGTCRATNTNDENYDATEYANATIIEWNSLYGIEDEGGFPQTTDSTQTVSVRESAVYCTMENLTLSNYWNCQATFTENGEYLFNMGLATVKSTDATTGEITYKFSEHRALALLVQSDKFKMSGCSLLGFQDTVEFFTGRQYLEDCYISGTTDFIFGTNNTTYFKNNEIHSIYNADSNGGYITAFKGCNKGDSDWVQYGAIFDGCNFTADSGVAASATAIGRPWGKYAAVMVMNSVLGNHISTAASTGVSSGQRYVAMNAKPTDSTVKFTEYNNTGAGAISATQDGCTVLDATTAANYNDYSVIFGTINGKVAYEDSWDPTSVVVNVDDRTYYTFNNTTSATGTSYAIEDFKTSDIDTKIYTANGMTFDGTAGNIQKRTTTSNQDLVLQAGGVITFEVEANTSVTINGYYQVSLDINGTKTTATTYTKFFSDATTVTITGVSVTSYLSKITINPNETAPAAATLTDIQVTGYPTSTLSLGTQVDLSNVVVTANYSDLSYTNPTDFTTDTSAVDPTNAGIYDVVISYGGMDFVFQVKYSATSTTYIAEDTTFDFTNYTASDYLDTSAATSFRDNSNSYQISGDISFKVFAGTKIVITGYSGYTSYTLTYDGATTDTITDVNKEITVTKSGVVTLTGLSNNYIVSIAIDTPKYVLEDITIDFTNYTASDYLDTSATTSFRDNSNSYQISGDISFYVEAGTTVAVTGYSGYTSYTLTYDGATTDTITDVNKEITVTKSGEVTLTGLSNNYIVSIAIDTNLYITEDTTIDFTNYTASDYLDTSATTSFRDNSNSYQISGDISFYVEAGAKIAITGYSGYTSYTLTYDGATTDTITDVNKEITVTSDGLVTLTGLSNNYIVSIVITY